MKWSALFNSSVGRKWTMGLTGIFLILFLIVHVGLNACIWAMDGGVMFNKAAHFMGANVIPRLLEVGLFAGFLLHIFQGWSLELTNRAARKKGYAVPMGNKGSKWYSRSMGILGTLLFLFLVMHLAHFWVPSRITGLEPVMIDGKEYHNLSEALIEGKFKKVCWFCLNKECACGSFFFKQVGPDEFCSLCGKKFEEEEAPINPS